MKLLRSVVGFFTDDLPSAALVIAWTGALWAAQQSGALRTFAGPVYFAGIAAILALSTCKRARR